MCVKPVPHGFLPQYIHFQVSGQEALAHVHFYNNILVQKHNTCVPDCWVQRHINYFLHLIAYHCLQSKNYFKSVTSTCYYCLSGLDLILLVIHGTQ